MRTMNLLSTATKHNALVAIATARARSWPEALIAKHGNAAVRAELRGHAPKHPRKALVAQQVAPAALKGLPMLYTPPTPAAVVPVTLTRLGVERRGVVKVGPARLKVRGAGETHDCTLVLEGSSEVVAEFTLSTRARTNLLEGDGTHIGLAEQRWAMRRR